MKTFYAFLTSIGACDDGLAHVTSVGGDAHKAWITAKDPNHLLWLLQELRYETPRGDAKKRAKMWYVRADNADTRIIRNGAGDREKRCAAIRGAVRWRRVERMLRAVGVQL